MSSFAFSLAKNTYLEKNSQGYFLISKAPIRTLRVNETLFLILQKLHQVSDISELIRQDSGNLEGDLLSLLLSLTYRGYLHLDRLAELNDYPTVSVIIPTQSISPDLIDCLESLENLDYPREKLEILVVVDSPSAGSVLDITRFKIKLIRMERAQGPSTARNLGAGQASGDILAFLDSDCIADKNWLKEITPFFKVEQIGAVGGFVGGYYQKNYLDRYEEVSSSLNLGKRILFEGRTLSNFYVPTCNMLVSRKAFQATGGFKNGMRLGEDVDFCWRMRKLGFSLLYIPTGRVAHKHRNRLFKMLRRRSAYGTSEASLYLSHKDKRKRFLIPIWASLSFIVIILAILLENPYPLFFVIPFLGIDLYQKSVNLSWFQTAFSFKQIILSTLRTHFSFSYFTCFHLVRYYLFLLVGFGFLFHPLFIFCFFAILLTSSVDYVTKKPRLSYPVYLFFYTLEHLAYQVGVFWGCLKLKYFGSYIPVFSRNQPI